MNEIDADPWKHVFNHDDYLQVLTLSIKCTVCQTELNWMFSTKKQVFKHERLKVLLCEGCSLVQSVPGGCSWCGMSSMNNDHKIYSCEDCDLNFCSTCVRHNFGIATCQYAQLMGPEWICFVCEGDINFLSLKGICFAAEEIVKTFQSMDNNIPQQTSDTKECSICLTTINISGNTRVYELPCKHQFHEPCLKEWIRTSHSCPLCRANNVNRKRIVTPEP